MNTFNKSDSRSVSVTHSHTGAVRTFLVKADGSQVISCAYKTPTGRFQRTRVQKLTKTSKKGYPSFTFNSGSSHEGAQRSDNLLVHRLVWAAWHNDGVMPPSGGEMHVDHRDEDSTNNHYTNLQLITAAENIAKGKAHHAVPKCCPNCGHKAAA